MEENKKGFLTETPKDYMVKSEKEKEDICHNLVEEFLGNILNVAPHINAIAVLNEAIDDNIEHNILHQRYEVCEFLKDIKTYLNN
jgi:DNA phosphorothioation-dependent restriction protein DptG